ncbi:hypothetical protein clem_09235 [Legionella clemsonensis]|uniref:Uncharacterized protein n=2 Tax=Legionella clemsonensis TaxID=1867846 RepID=A0A222P3J0_9GAMM|nr:hypothetical protein clem_09235 [Legionella clemsonensis]
MGFYPDVLLYLDDEKEYQAEILRLAAARYLYTDGFDIRPASFLRYAFETFKGWLGLGNHCQQEKIQLGLLKFAYYGYLKGFSQERLSLLPFQQISASLFTYLCAPRTNQITEILQNSLIRFYVSHVQPHVATEGEPLISSDTYSFGRTWANLACWTEIPKLDPQNNALIAETAQQLKNHPSRYVFLQNSQYALAVATLWLEEIKSSRRSYRVTNFIRKLFNLSKDAKEIVEKALHFAPDIHKQDKNFFINFYLEKKDFDAAFNLIETLEDISEAITLLTTQFSKAQLLKYIKKDSSLAIALSRHYLAEDTDELDIIRFAAQFNSNLEKEFTAQGFLLLVAEKRYKEAYQLYINAEKNSAFFIADIEKLAEYFETQSIAKEKEAKLFKKQKNWEQVKSLALEGIEFIKMALLLDNRERRQELRAIHRCLYAEALIENDSNHAVENCNIGDINKSINLLRKCYFTNSMQQKTHLFLLAKGLMRQIDYQIHSLLPFSYEIHYHFEQYTKEHSTAINNVTVRLKELIALLEKTNDEKLKVILGKAYFLLGDTIKFFGLSENFHPYFEAAMKTVPTNPFYVLRCSEITESEKERARLQEKGVPLLKDLNYTVYDYDHWDCQRWWKDKIPEATPIADIHQLGIVQKSGWGINLS